MSSLNEIDLNYLRLILVSHGQTAYFSFDMGAEKNKRSGHARLDLYTPSLTSLLTAIFNYTN